MRAPYSTLRLVCCMPELWDYYWLFLRGEHMPDSQTFMPAGPTGWVALEIARGAIPGISTIKKFGANRDINGTKEDIWDGGGLFQEPLAARIHDIVSDSIADEPAGVGARTILVEGVDQNGDLVTEVVAMDGITNVPTINQYLMIHRMFIITVGSAGEAAGTITATAQVDGTVTAQISAGRSSTQTTLFRVPAKHTAYLCDPRPSLLGTTVNSDTEFEWCHKDGDDPDAAWLQFEVFALRSAGTSAHIASTTVPYVVPAGHLIKALASASAINTAVGFSYTIILVRETP